ncbi:MAG: hypothetical protein A2096_15830 [Spirochaetes bacterium GWF1_41_5]|nr:MAG: hypothetical protein A2096_15830 [Spirochaetes bacterium GWF1_41_5]
MECEISLETRIPTNVSGRAKNSKTVRTDNSEERLRRNFNFVRKNKNTGKKKCVIITAIKISIKKGESILKKAMDSAIKTSRKKPSTIRCLILFLLYHEFISKIQYTGTGFFYIIEINLHPVDTMFYKVYNSAWLMKKFL